MSEVVNFIKKALKTSQTASALTLSGLKQMFLKAYHRYTGTSINLHSTRLEEKLISKIPGLQAHRRGKQVILKTGEVITETELAALSYSDDDDGKLWYKLQNLFVKFCLTMKTNLNSILIRILKKIPSQ